MGKLPSFDWHMAKAQGNLTKHGVAFEAVKGFEFDTALYVEDNRTEYGEVRVSATGFIGDRLHVLIFTLREPDVVWVISLRKANRRESDRYVAFATPDEG
ncbi:BrnT family toxin [Aureimonas altamirensis]|uniref:BrnT family toxin n=1 Tax=Aureimonas altamirensis TaxID=370622 RepID=UPI002036DE5A|nr:BrnT family toxin [Aureimonas altamirensis]MCM2503023.1 BrnT family toxin [Aureimonas altamirensis]